METACDFRIKTFIFSKGVAVMAPQTSFFASRFYCHCTAFLEYRDCDSSMDNSRRTVSQENICHFLMSVKS